METAFFKLVLTDLPLGDEIEQVKYLLSKIYLYGCESLYLVSQTSNNSPRIFSIRKRSYPTVEVDWTTIISDIPAEIALRIHNELEIPWWDKLDLEWARGEMVDTADLKSADNSREGSSPSVPTTIRGSSMQIDKDLGIQIHELLKSLGVETPLVENFEGRCSPHKVRLEVIEENMASIMDVLGLDLGDDSLQDTPKRVAKMFCEEIFGGLDYENFPKCTRIQNKMGYDEIVLVRGNTLRSCCEHHIQPIYGKVHIAYIPDKWVIGLSKLNRVADFFASRPQVQERLTEQIFQSLRYILETDDIAVIIEAEHFCMKMRGVEDACSDTVTSKMGGKFRSNEAARLELMALLKT